MKTIPYKPLIIGLFAFLLAAGGWLAKGAFFSASWSPDEETAKRRVTQAIHHLETSFFVTEQNNHTVDWPETFLGDQSFTSVLRFPEGDLTLSFDHVMTYKANEVVIDSKVNGFDWGDQIEPFLEDPAKIIGRTQIYETRTEQSIAIPNFFFDAQQGQASIDALTRTQADITQDDVQVELEKLRFEDNGLSFFLEAVRSSYAQSASDGVVQVQGHNLVISSQERGFKIPIRELSVRASRQPGDPLDAESRTQSKLTISLNGIEALPLFVSAYLGDIRSTNVELVTAGIPNAVDVDSSATKLSSLGSSVIRTEKVTKVSLDSSWSSRQLNPSSLLLTWIPQEPVNLMGAQANINNFLGASATLVADIHLARPVDHPLVGQLMNLGLLDSDGTNISTDITLSQGLLSTMNGNQIPLGEVFASILMSAVTTN